MFKMCVLQETTKVYFCFFLPKTGSSVTLLMQSYLNTVLKQKKKKTQGHWNYIQLLVTSK